MKGYSRHNSSLIGRKNQAKFDNDRISRNGHRIKTTQPNLMILVSFSSAEDVWSNDVNRYNTFSSQCTENPPFHFFWDTRYIREEKISWIMFNQTLVHCVIFICCQQYIIISMCTHICHAHTHTHTHTHTRLIAFNWRHTIDDVCVKLYLCVNVWTCWLQCITVKRRTQNSIRTTWIWSIKRGWQLLWQPWTYTYIIVHNLQTRTFPIPTPRPCLLVVITHKHFDYNKIDKRGPSPMVGTSAVVW